MRHLATITPSAAPALPASVDLSDALRYAAAAPADNSVRAYTSDWAHFSAWCAASDAAPLPAAPDLVAAYLASMATTHARATLLRRLASISRAHAQADLVFWRSHPRIRDVLRGIAREHGSAPVKSAALMVSDVRAMVERCDGLAGLRDAALILVGMAGALRRSELVGIEVEHLHFTRDGLTVLLTESKTDKLRQGTRVAVPFGTGSTCPVMAVRAWLDAAGITEGPIFRRINHNRVGTDALTGQAVADIVKKRAAAAGIEPPAGETISPHGLRAGCITEMARAGEPIARAMEHSRHASVAVHMGYQRRARMGHDSPASRIGL